MDTTQTAPRLNRQGRRTNTAMVRKLHGFNQKQRIKKVIEHESTQRALGLQSRLALIRTRTEVRTKLRKEIAAREGVNWHRIVLMPPKVERKQERVATHYFRDGVKVIKTRLVGESRLDKKYVLPSDTPYIIKATYGKGKGNKN